MIVNKISKWMDKKDKEIEETFDIAPKPIAKACGFGILEGAVDVVFVYGVLWTLSATISIIAKKPVGFVNPKLFK